MCARLHEPLLVVVPKADAVVCSRRDQAGDGAESKQERGEPDVALEVVHLCETVVERNDEQEREQDLHAWQREA